MPPTETDLYRVLLLNDDKTPMEFVVNVLQDVFEMDRDGATNLMCDFEPEIAEDYNSPRLKSRLMQCSKRMSANALRLYLHAFLCNQSEPVSVWSL